MTPPSSRTNGAANEIGLRRTRVALTLTLAALALVASACAREAGDRETAERRETAETGERPKATETAEATEAPDTAGSRAEHTAPPLVWVGVEDARRLVLVDLAAGEVRERHRTPGGPHNVTVADGGTAAAALYDGDHLALVRDGELALVELGGTPHDVKAVGSLLVVANEAARRLDFVRGGKRVRSVRLEAEPHDLAIAPGGDVAWVTLNGTDELAVVDVGEGEVLRYVSTGERPHDVLFAPDGRLWVTDWRGPVHVFTRDGELDASIELGEEAHHLTFTPDGREVWVTDHGVNRVFVIQARTAEVVASLAVPGSPHHVAITADGELAAVADHDNGTLVVFDVQERRRVRTIEVGAGPHGVWAVGKDGS